MKQPKLNAIKQILSNLKCIFGFHDWRSTGYLKRTCKNRNCLLMQYKTLNKWGDAK